MSTKHLGTTSFTLATEFRIAGEEAVLATSESVYVHVDTHTLKKSPIPRGCARRWSGARRGEQWITRRICQANSSAYS